MEIMAANHSSYPRIGDGLEQQAHRQAYSKREKGEISEEEFERVLEKVAKEAIEEQVGAGLELVTDGLIRWYDPISHFSRGFGCDVNGLLRFFDTNFYFRQPIVNGKVSWKGPTVVREFSFAKGVSPKPVKAVVTGPYTLAKLSINRSGADIKSLAESFAGAVAREVKELSKAGAGIIQVEEPAILKNTDDIGIFTSAIEDVADERGQAEIMLCTYFGDASPIYSELVELPVDGLGFDFTYSPCLADEIIMEGCDKNLGLGVIDGRNTKMDQTREVLGLLEKILPKVRSARVYLTPSCGIGDYLPREVAFKKLQKVAEVAKKAEELI
ncbi:MAG: hypothetical protein AB1476_04630 [Candidatus Hadarchaeota archaeon]